MGRQQVLEHAPQQLRVQRDLLIEGRVLLHGELEAAKEREQAVFGVQQDAGGHMKRLALRADVRLERRWTCVPVDDADAPLVADGGARRATKAARPYTKAA